ncbi:restriction endonuclease subunit S [Vibrio cholerae]
MSWPMVSLSRVATINPRCPKDIDENQLVSFVAMASASEEGILLQEEIRVLGETKKGFTYFEKEDVLLAKITPCFENGKSLRPFQISKQVGFGSTEFHVVRADEKKLLPQYLFYLLWSNAFRFAGEHAMSGAAGQKRVGTDFLKNFEIPLPPLDEQKRIAAILDKADAIRQKRKQAITLADEFLRSVFLEMFGDPVTNPKGWEVRSIRDFITIQGGYAFKSSDFTEDGVPVVKIGNANKHGFTTKNIAFINPENSEKLKQYELYAGDLLMSLTGTVGKDDYGNITEVTNEFGMYYLNQRVAKITVKDSNMKSYLKFVFKHPKIKAEITKNNRGVRQANIGNSDIYCLTIPIPSNNALKIFEKIVLKARELQTKADSFPEQSVAMFNALSQKAFSGQL